MIVPGRVHAGQILHYVGLPLALLFAWDVVITAVFVYAPTLPMPLLGTVLAIFLGFRNATAYARWYEARTLWGSLVNHSRSFAREVMMLLPQEAANLQRELILRHIAYAHALRLHLRRELPWDELAKRLPGDELEHLRAVANVPNAILQRSADLLGRRSNIDDIRLVAIERSMVEFSNAQGGMERIRNTPFPRQYATYPIFFTHIFCVLLPVGLVETLGWYTPLGSTAVGFLFLALLQIGTDMQSPFSNSENDVPLTTLTRSIEIDLRDGLKESHCLEPVQMENGVLW
jgi:putative membrane protein